MHHHLISLQRLTLENEHQEEMIKRLIQRIDDCEEKVQHMQHEQQQLLAKQGWFGGFIGPKAL